MNASVYSIWFTEHGVFIGDDEIDQFIKDHPNHDRKVIWQSVTMYSGTVYWYEWLPTVKQWFGRTEQSVPNHILIEQLLWSRK